MSTIVRRGSLLVAAALVAVAPLVQSDFAAAQDTVTFRVSGQVSLQDFSFEVEGPITSRRDVPVSGPGGDALRVEIISMRLTGSGPGGIVSVTENVERFSDGALADQDPQPGFQFPARGAVSLFVSFRWMGHFEAANSDPFPLRVHVTAFPPA